jgi:hypothetical protein
MSNKKKCPTNCFFKGEDKIEFCRYKYRHVELKQIINILFLIIF